MNNIRIVDAERQQRKENRRAKKQQRLHAHFEHDSGEVSHLNAQDQGVSSSLRESEGS